MFIRSMHDLPHCNIAPMHQCIFIFMCMFIVFKQSKTLINIKRIKLNKIKQSKKTDTQSMKTRLNKG